MMMMKKEPHPTDEAPFLWMNLTVMKSMFKKLSFSMYEGDEHETRGIIFLVQSFRRNVFSIL